MGNYMIDIGYDQQPPQNRLTRIHSVNVGWSYLTSGCIRMLPKDLAPLGRIVNAKKMAG